MADAISGPHPFSRTVTPRECSLGNDHPYQGHCQRANTFEEWKELALTGWSYQELSPNRFQSYWDSVRPMRVANFKQFLYPDVAALTPTTAFTIYRRPSQSPALWREAIHIHLFWRRRTQSIRFCWCVQEENVDTRPTTVTMGLSDFDVQERPEPFHELRSSVKVFGRMLFDKFFSRYFGELSHRVKDHPFAGRAIPDEVEHFLWR